MAGIRHGRGMSLMTIAKNYGIYPTSVAAATDSGPKQPLYKANPQIGDIVEWTHLHSNRHVWLRGEVVGLLTEREDHHKHRPEGVAKRRWRESKNYVGCKRVIVRVDQENGLPLYYTVTYARYAKNCFQVVQRAAGRQEQGEEQGA